MLVRLSYNRYVGAAPALALPPDTQERFVELALPQPRGLRFVLAAAAAAALSLRVPRRAVSERAIG